MKPLRLAVGGVGRAILGGTAWVFLAAPADDARRTPVVETGVHGAASGAPAIDATAIVVPQLSAAASNGLALFERNCASCHGRNASGTDHGPPLVHRVYEPSHHADFAFVRAVRNGVQAHHWRYGDMPPVEGLSDKQIEWIASYVRELQRANGIE